MLTRFLAVANPMNFKFPYFLLQTVPFWILGLQGVASAQVSPPSPPPTEPLTNIQSATSDTIVIQDANQFNISGGQSSGGTAPNLVHQFQNFDLVAGDAANFLVDPNVANVISLINSIQPSSIDGILSIVSNDTEVASNASLFLVNPAGIIFGENISLNLPANLTASTSSGLLFEDQFLLSIDGSISEIVLPSEQTSDTESISDSAIPNNVLDTAISVEVPTASNAAPTVPVEAPTISNLSGAPSGYLFLIESEEGLEPSTPFSSTLPTGSIENQGELQVNSQASITLIGQFIQNDGRLVAPGGAVSLVAASGEKLVRLSQPGSLLSLEVIPVDELTVLSSSAEQSSSIAALPASNLAEMLTGGNEENATQIQVNPDGSQVLTGAPSLVPTPGSVLVRGTIDVSDNTPLEQEGSPGQINILGNQINLIGADLHADGVSQAGTISIGDTSVVDGFSAAFILVDRSSELSAISLDANGGTIQIVADDTVSFFGDATVTGASSDIDGTLLIEAGNLVDIRQPGPSR